MKVTDEQNLELRHANPIDILYGFDAVLGEVDDLQIVEGDVLNSDDDFRLFIIAYITFSFTNSQIFDSPLFN